MEDEAYYSGNLQTETGSGEILKPGAPESEGLGSLGGPVGPVTGSGTPTTHTGGIKDQMSHAIPLQTQSRRKRTVPSKFHKEGPGSQHVGSAPGSSVGKMDLSTFAFGKRPGDSESDSPTSDYGSGNFPETSVSMEDPNQPLTDKTRLPPTQTQEHLQSASTRASEPQAMEVSSSGAKLPTAKLAIPRYEKPIRDVRDRSESPSVPPVAENIEVMTESGMERELMRPEGSTMKRTAAVFIMQESSKSPRLSDVVSAVQSSMSQRPIRVPTIVSTGSTIKPVPIARGRKSPEKMEAQSPVAMVTVGGGPQLEPAEIEVRTVSPLTPGRTGHRVNFESIPELSRSDRPMIVERMETQGTRDNERRRPLITQARVGESSSFTERRSPKPVESPLPPSSSPMAVENLVSPKRRHSPRSPRSPHSDSERNGKKSDSERDPSEGYHSATAESKAEGKKDGEPGAQNALLQVTEAHLAILPDEDGDTPLHLAIIHENYSLTRYLVQLIVGVYMNLDIANNMRQTPLHLTVITRQPLMVQLLVSAGASVNFPDRKGNTSIHLAAQRRDVRTLQLLAQATSPLPDFNARNFAGLSAVHVATKEASIDVLKFLFQMGANKNTADACSGRTPLHYAVESENFILVNFLLESGCNVNAATFAGNTPLHIAAGRRLKEIVALLMAYGANPAIANGEGDFPSDLPASLLMHRAKMNAH